MVVVAGLTDMRAKLRKSIATICFGFEDTYSMKVCSQDYGNGKAIQKLYYIAHKGI